MLVFPELFQKISIYLILHDLFLSVLLDFGVFSYIQYLNLCIWHLRNNMEFILTSKLLELIISIQKNQLNMQAQYSH